MKKSVSLILAFLVSVSSFLVSFASTNGKDDVNEFLHGYKFPHSEYSRPDVVMGTCLIPAKDVERMAKGEGWDFVRKNVNGFWLNMAGTKNVRDIIRASNSKRAMLVIGINGHKPIKFNGSANAQSKVANSLKMEVLGANVVPDYTTPRYMLKGEMETVRSKFTESLGIPNFYPNTRHGDWIKSEPSELMEDVIKNSNGIVYEQNPITLSQQLYYDRYKNAAIYARKKGKPIIWLSPVGTVINGWNDGMKKAYFKMKNDNILPDMIVPINYSRNSTKMEILPEINNNGTFPNTLTGNVNWLLKQIAKDFPNAKKNKSVKWMPDKSNGWVSRTRENFSEVALNKSIDLSKVSTIESPKEINVSSVLNNKINIRVKNNSNASRLRVYFKTNLQYAFRRNYIDVNIEKNNDKFQDYVVDMSKHDRWTGMIKQIRVDVMPRVISKGTVEFEEISLTPAHLID